MFKWQKGWNIDRMSNGRGAGILYRTSRGRGAGILIDVLLAEGLEY